MVETKKPIWSAGINLAGVWSKTPIKMYWHDASDAWWDDSADLFIRKLGLCKKDGIITFSSYKKRDVEIFLMGIKALHTRIKRLVQ
jgi:hypothetical protein